MSEEDEYLTVEEVADRLGIAAVTAWKLLQRAKLQRYRLPGRGKTTFVKWADAERAYHSPRPVAPERAGDSDPKKAAA